MSRPVHHLSVLTGRAVLLAAGGGRMQPPASAGRAPAGGGYDSSGNGSLRSRASH
jgi:hypothetical protein